MSLAHRAAFLLCCACAALVLAAPSRATQQAAIDPELKKVVADYVGLYRAETLPQWKRLFHPALVVAYPLQNGDVRVRNLEEFYQAQARGFAAGPMSERLENVEFAAARRIARVNADFIFNSQGKDARGKLGLHLVQASDGWKIVAIVFSYDRE